MCILLGKLNYFSNETNLANMPEEYNTISVSESNRTELNELVFTCILKTFESMSTFTKKQYTAIVWKAIYAKIEEFKDDKASMIHLLLIIDAFLQANNCYLIEDLDIFLQVFFNLNL